MEQITATVTVLQADGWHARPATEFARIVGEFGLSVTIGRHGDEPVRGDSVLSLMTLGARQNENLVVTVSFQPGDAESAHQLIEAIRELF